MEVTNLTNLDARGIKRGKCLQDDCDCSEYEKPEKEHACSYCSHLAPQHENLTKSSM